MAARGAFTSSSLRRFTTRIAATFEQNKGAAAVALFAIEPQSFNYLANRGGVECRHAAGNAREPGGQ
jgi:hypothetical protein